MKLTWMQNSTSMNMQQQQFKLIDGEFSPAQAKSILLELLQHKINFHAREQFSNQERFGKDLLNSAKRIEELKLEESKIREMLDAVQAQDVVLKIKSSIDVEIIKPSIK
jgi:hypothetical protein